MKTQEEYAAIFKNSSLPLKERQIAFLDATANFYTSETRCFSEEEKACQYAPIEGKSPGCAIGRWMEDKEQCQYWGTSIVTSINSEDLPIWMLEIGNEDRSFLLDVQDLHDVGIHWDENGLTSDGKRRYRDILQSLEEE